MKLHLSFLLLFASVPTVMAAQNKDESSCPVSGSYKDRIDYHKMFLAGTKVMIESEEAKAKSTIDSYTEQLKNLGWTTKDAESLTSSVAQSADWRASEKLKQELMSRYANDLKVLYSEPEVTPQTTCSTIESSWQTLFQIATESMRQYGFLIRSLKAEHAKRTQGGR